MPLLLSEAIRLGSLLVPEPRPYISARCAIGMALLANGIHPAIYEDYRAILQLYPWLSRTWVSCPWCNRTPENGVGILTHPFDHHIMIGRIIRLEQLCDWIAGFELPEEFAEGAKSVLALPA